VDDELARRLAEDPEDTVLPLELARVDGRASVDGGELADGEDTRALGLPLLLLLAPRLDA